MASNAILERICPAPLEPAPERRTLVLANPRAKSLLAWERADRRRGGPFDARRADSNSCINLLQRTIDLLDLNACVEPIPAPHALDKRVRVAVEQGFDTIVAAGGDGTVRAIAQGLVGSDVSLGILPLGTDNNFARAIGVPFELIEACDTLRNGRALAVDVGRVGDEYFLESAGVGLFADALLAFGPDEPRLHEVGRMARVLCPLFWNVRPKRLALTLDGEELEEQVMMVTAANAAYFGPSVPVAPEARLTDGRLDVVIVGARSRADLIRFGIALCKGRHLDLPGVAHKLASQIEIRAARGGVRNLPIHADDHIAMRTPARIDVVPRCLNVLVPRSG